MCSHVGGLVPIEVQGAEEGVWGAGAQPPAGSRGGAPGGVPWKLLPFSMLLDTRKAPRNMKIKGKR